MESTGIAWHPLRYHKRLSVLSTAYDVARGLAVARRVVGRRGVGVVHARGYVTSVVALRLAASAGVRFLFDMRGFWPDEKVDAGTGVEASFTQQGGRPRGGLHESRTDGGRPAGGARLRVASPSPSAPSLA